ncbi:MAG TPA: DUF4381 domain-containing protein [Pseudomonas xinjiangensis]|uniref:DUF4381 domain-containing protein n=2 Tax=root TaxID=1 RepID=A0A7V1FSX4_9GAMM|nr:DUF4381 domain-containing protein [Halopseudomonas xinjiangensis]HEC46192.1 DUF4381 domain-containing protein [Halopseudomonas xinjiangensis]
MNETLQGLLIQPSPPPPVPWWPLAPGWWMVAAALVVMLLLMPWLIRIVRRHNLSQQKSRAALEVIDDQLPDREWLTAMNSLIKRLLKRQGQEAATRLHGEVWLDYLCRRYPKPQRTVLQPLGSALYRPAIKLTGAQRHALKREMTRWMRHNHV